MARLRTAPTASLGPGSDSDDSVPELASILLQPLHKKPSDLNSPRKRHDTRDKPLSIMITEQTPKRVLKSPTKPTTAPLAGDVLAQRKRRTLKPLQSDYTLLNRLWTPAKDHKTSFDDDDSDIVGSAKRGPSKSTRKSPVKRAVRKHVATESDEENVAPDSRRTPAFEASGKQDTSRTRPQRSPAKKNYRETIASDSEKEQEEQCREEAVYVTSDEDDEPTRRPARTRRALADPNRRRVPDKDSEGDSEVHSSTTEQRPGLETIQPIVVGNDQASDVELLEGTFVEESIFCDSGSSDDSDVQRSPSDAEDSDDNEHDRWTNNIDRKSTQTVENSPSRQLFGEVAAREASHAAQTSTGSRPTTSSSNNLDAFLRFSPKASRSPRKAPPSSTHRPVTPPLQSPTKTKLTSPSKQRVKIPTPPHGRPSLDAFWDVGTVNDWHDRHSPEEPLLSPRKGFKTLLQHTISDSNASSSSDISTPPSPTTATRKPPTSTHKRTLPPSPQKLLLADKRAFEARKQGLASSFLAELDARITSAELGALSAAAGGIKLIWSNKLQSTAGRANWRREVLRLKHTDGSVEQKILHHASIELATKVISDDTRLLNVIAHEFCHLANFMVSQITNNPHGKSFREWARKVTKEFGDRGIEVTTKHTYQIEYKYIWACVGCGQEYKRHSKSVDVKRHSCSVCKGVLEQVKPKPRSGGSEYQVFVKKNFARVKKQVVDGGHAAVMERLGKEYREWKDVQAKKKAGGDDGLDGLMEGLKL